MVEVKRYLFASSRLHEQDEVGYILTSAEEYEYLKLEKNTLFYKMGEARKAYRNVIKVFLQEVGIVWLLEKLTNGRSKKI